ncbi:MAG: T9SS type A sorting domain-containing protein [Bacteroidota bacterium]
MKHGYLFIAALLLCIGSLQSQTITALKSGVWNSDTTWVGGVVPTAASSVVIDTGMTVTIGTADAVCNNLDVNGTLAFIDAPALGLTVNGNLTVGFKGFFNTAQTNAVTIARAHTIVLYKDLTVTAGGKFDMRRGSGALVGVGRLILTGTTNTNITLSQTAYSSTIEEFNSVVINKTGGAKVVLAAGNLYQNNNTTNSADTLLFISGMIETGNNQWIHLATTAAGVVGASSTSYVNGILGRGLSNSAGATRKLDVGDSSGYRPVTIQTTVSGVATGHYVWAKVVKGNANTGSSTFTGGIDKVSSFRYYQVGYFAGAGAASMSFARFSPSYRDNDGVTAGNMDLRSAYSTDSRATWNGIGPATDTTNLLVLPRTIVSDSLATPVVVAGGSSVHVALARKSGTTTNPLALGTSVRGNDGNVPSEFSLNQNYPNPFNPSTTLGFTVQVSGPTTLRVYDALGRVAATLVDGEIEAGVYQQKTFDASLLSSGIYFARLENGGKTQMIKMMLIK